MRQLFGVAVRASVEVGNHEGVVATAHIALALAGLFLGNRVLGHFFSPAGVNRLEIGMPKPPRCILPTSISPVG